MSTTDATAAPTGNTGNTGNTGTTEVTGTADLTAATAATAPTAATLPPAPGGTKGTRRIAAVVVGLAAAITLLLCAFGLPSANGGPHHAPLGVSGPRQAVAEVRERLPQEQWDVKTYANAHALTEAIHDRDVVGGLALGADGVDVYTASAGGQQISTAISGLGTGLADQRHVKATTHEVVGFGADDPHGTGLGSLALPLMFGGILPVLILALVAPGAATLRARLGGVIAFALVAAAGVTAVLHFATGTIDGEYARTWLGLAFGMLALGLPFLGLQSLFGQRGFLGLAVAMMFLGNPLSGLATGPYWLPDGWSTLGQLLPMGAAGSLLRADAFFDGTGAGAPLAVLGTWSAAGLAMVLVALRRAGRGEESRVRG
ncbi:hypothetical protein [Streptomyces sp. NPDC088674]|uniref:hypothetical protein n=1 Tax=Streptomyces sp. NPDC088674 TaxID=3365869 RepID=UPI0038063B9A